MTRFFASRLAFVALLPLSLGCAAQSDSSGKQIRELTEQVRRIQSTSDRLEERLAALENSRNREWTKPPSAATPTGTMPDLPVVKMNPEANSAGLDSRQPAGDGEEPRPLIFGEGARVETRTSGGELPATSAATRRPKDKVAPETSTTKRSNGAADSRKKTP